MRKTSPRVRKPVVRNDRRTKSAARSRAADRSVAATLTKSQLLRGTPPVLTRELLGACLRRDLDSGEALLTPAQTNATLYVLLRGQMHVLLGESRDTVVPVLPGDCVGEMSIIDGSRVSAPVVATEPSTLLAIDVERFWWLTERYPVIARNLLTIMAQRVRMTNTALTIRIRAHEREELLARLDQLTTVYNRRWLEENLPHYLERAQHAGSALVLGLFDIDNFKSYNDTWGHVAGDTALRAVARAVREHIRPPDQLCRFGGEEFCLVLPDTPLAKVPKLGERLLHTISSLPIRSSSGETTWPAVTVSLGFTASLAEDTPESLVRRADRLLYEAKNGGRNRYALDTSDN
jgi:diguanylate cyclase (GGDEF)-like protein